MCVGGGGGGEEIECFFKHCGFFKLFTLKFRKFSRQHFSAFAFLSLLERKSFSFYDHLASRGHLSLLFGNALLM